jgi:glycosyltransferase involved in cell wall biosynthesis
MGVTTSAATGRVLLDARPLQGASGLRGMGTYVRGLFEALCAEGFDRELALLLDGGEGLPKLPGGDYVIFTVRRRYRGRLAPYEDAVALPRELERIAPRLFHGTTLSLPSRLPCPTVITVHDLIPWALGGGRMWGERLRYRIGRGVLRRAEAVIAPSEATAADAVRLAGVARDRIRVVPEAVNGRLRRVAGASGARWGVEKPFLLYVGALDARKNPAALLRAWQVARARGADCELVLAGAAGRQAPARMGAARRLGYVSTEELALLLSAASCLVFPSRYEGFGLPVLEAMACGCPVVAYRNSSIPEAMGDAGTMVDDGDAVAMGEAAAAYLLDPDLARQARDAGMRQAARFSWRRAARATRAVYGEALRAADA